ncbi:hypothetical protein ABPG74_015962 [Tetrahymena malaccensis]
MGASKSKDQQDQNAELDFSIDIENLQFVKQVEDARYGKCKIFKSDKFDHLIALVRKILQRDSEVELKSIQDTAHSLNNLNHDSVVKLLRYKTSKKSELCSSYWNIDLFYEFISNDLESDIQRRKKEEVFYDESELWHIIVSTVAALAYLRSRGYEHGDIKPSSILLSDQGRVKLLPNPIVSSGNLNNYMQAFMGMRKAKYLSPVLMKSLELQSQKPQHNCTKSDIFSLGLVILEAALLMEQDDIYDFVNFDINQQILELKINFVQEKYSIQLAEFIKSMLIFDELERPDVDILFAYIEELCRQGIQMADRIFSLGLKDRQPTYNYTHENEDDQYINQRFNELQNSNSNDYESVKKNANNNFFTPVKEIDYDDKAKQYQNDQNQEVIYRQEIVRRSKWTLEENPENNNLYLGSTSAQLNQNYDLNSNLNKLYTFSDTGNSVSKQVTFGSQTNGNYKTTQALLDQYTPLASYDPIFQSSQQKSNDYNINQYSSIKVTDYNPTVGSGATGISSTTTGVAPSAYVPMLVKDYNYTSSAYSKPITPINNGTSLYQTSYNQDINNLDSINKIISKYSYV